MLPVAMVPFATVHPLARGLVSLVAGVLGGLALLWGIRQRRPSSYVFGFTFLGAVALLLSGMAFFPVEAGQRLGLQPGLGPVVNDALALAGVVSAPLALDAHGALLEWSVSAYMLLFTAGVALAIRSADRAGTLAWVSTASAVGLVVVAAAHRLSDAEHIWWVSEVPEFSREAFFGTFVNPNDGGLLCAAALLLSLGLVFRHSGSLRWVALGAVAALAVGVRVSGSRGAILSGAVGLFVFVLVAGGRRVRVGASAVAALGLVAAILVGPRDVAESLSLWLVPEALGPGEDVYTGRGDVNLDTLALIAAAPFVGVGHAGFDDGFHVVKSTPTFATTVHAHQELLQIAAEHGIPVLLLWLLAASLVAGVVLRAAVWGELSRRRQMLLAGAAGAVACVGVACLFSFPLRIGALEVLLGLSVGTCLGLGSGEDRARLSGTDQAMRVLGVALFLVALTLQATALARADSEQPLFGSADVAIAAGDARVSEGGGDAAYSRAAREYRLAIARQPLRRDALQKLSRALFALDDFEGATRSLVVATRVYPTLAWPWRDLARLQRRLGEYEASRNTWRRMLSLDLPEGDDRLYVEEALRGPGDPARIANLVLPQRADRLAVGARVLEGQEAFDVAERLYRRAALLNPRYQAHLGSALLRWERPREALDAVSGEPVSCFSLRIRGEALLRLNSPEPALEAWQQALDTCGNTDAEAFREVRLGMARSRIALADARGLTTLDTMLRENPDDVQVRRLLIASLRKLGLDGRLAEELDKLVRSGRATAAERAEYQALTMPKR